MSPLHLAGDGGVENAQLKHYWDFTSSMEEWYPWRSSVMGSSEIVLQMKLTNEIDL